jgi:putative ABC transport system ATP-binding protein
MYKSCYNNAHSIYVENCNFFAMLPYILVNMFRQRLKEVQDMNATTTVIDLQGVGKTFDGPAGPIHALRDVQLNVNPGEFVGVRGPSGSGKSTLINMITGIDRPSRGEVVVNGQSLNDLNENKLARWRGKNIGVIFQFFQLLPTLTVLENVVLPMDFCRVWWPAAARSDCACSGK